jgi:hypothetical protein
VDAVTVWRRYNGRADLENRIKGLGDQFGIKRLCGDNFWDTEALHHLAIAAYNLCVLLQRRLGQLEKCELNTLRWRLFGQAVVWSRAVANRRSNWPSGALLIATGGGKCWPNSPRYPTARQLPRFRHKKIAGKIRAQLNRSGFGSFIS